VTIELLKNTDSHRFAFHRITSVDGHRWWLLNLVVCTLLVNHPTQR
jgi:hypothetical protein